MDLDITFISAVSLAFGSGVAWIVHRAVKDLRKR